MRRSRLKTFLAYSVSSMLMKITPSSASSLIYSLNETAKENGLDLYRYLLWVLQNAPQLSETDEAWAEKLLPANTPEECCIPQK